MAKSNPDGSLPVVILAGGFGTRLGSFSRKFPKSLVPVLGRPFLFHQIELLKRKSIKRIIFCLGYKSELILKTLNEDRSGLSFDFVFDGRHALGTGGAVRKATELISGDFFVLYGDSYLDIDYQAVQKIYERVGKQGLMVLYKNKNQIERSNVVFKNGLVTEYDKRKTSSRMEYIDYGLSVLNKKAMKGFLPGKKFDLSEIFSRLITKRQLAGTVVRKRFYEVGSLQGIKELEKYLKK
ncbi:MAG: D-glycero-alpha-D-manno-heptose 1-phosphate guanylyltransferase [Elusimicrobia bacterium]|nr:D-glycero-alpha-D-manno-heptose 1-phosphate guanylyltransferase [Elusimicrobiota bacterium]